MQMLFLISPSVDVIINKIKMQGKFSMCDGYATIYFVLECEVIV
jgi:hypothetical protein